MRRHPPRLVLTPDGGLLAIDPDFATEPLLRSIAPSFAIREAPLPGFVHPRFRALREAGAGVLGSVLPTLTEDDLWALHARVVPERHTSAGEATALDLKIELASRLLRHCNLCARRCGIDRIAGELGACRLGPQAWVAEHFVHIAEEAPINPSLVLGLHGCALRCRYCQQHAILGPRLPTSVPLEAALWPQLDVHQARSLSFVGGNPDESLPAILRFLRAAPAMWALPVVWNNHAYATPEALRLLAGVVDAYVPDLKYGNDTCGRQLAGVADYPATALASIAHMLAQDVPVIVRVLILPGHGDCCHRPALHALAALPHRDHLLLSLRPHYLPDWRIRDSDGNLARRIQPLELTTLQSLCHALRLATVE